MHSEDYTSMANSIQKILGKTISELRELEETDTVAGDVADAPKPFLKKKEDELEEAFVIDKGAKVAMKLKNGKMIYGKVLKQQRVLGKAGVEVQWSDGTKGRFPTDKFSALSMDSKADYKIEETELEEANTDKYMWKDINKALMAAGVNPRTIMKVTAGLRGKAIKEEVEEEVNEALKPGPIDPRTLAGKIITGEVKLLTVDQSSPGARQTYILATGKPSTMGAPPDSIYIDATGSRPRGSGLAIGFRLSEVKKAEIKRDGSARVSLK